MYAKIICLLFAVAAISAAPQNAPANDCVPGQNHSLKLGQRVSGDVQVYDGSYSMSTTNGVLEKDLTWTSVDGRKITYIEVMDQLENGLGGCASVVTGGVGEKSVKIHMKTPKNGSFKFSVKVFVK